MLQYFVYDEKMNKNSCLVKMGSDVNNKKCGLQLVGSPFVKDKPSVPDNSVT